MLISSLSAYFQGKKELFKGLAIEQLEQDWTVYPVLHLDLNISMDARYAEICGISEKELHTCFKEEIEDLAALNQTTYEAISDELRLNYDGYHFAPHTTGMYNPFSVLNTLDSMEFGSYWFETGTPTYLVELLQQKDYELEKVDGIDVGEEGLSGVDAADTDAIPVIYQSGYLTIKDYDREFGTYTLGFPNREVERGFIKFLVPF